MFAFSVGAVSRVGQAAIEHENPDDVGTSVAAPSTPSVAINDRVVLDTAVTQLMDTRNAPAISASHTPATKDARKASVIPAIVAPATIAPVAAATTVVSQNYPVRTYISDQAG